MAEKKPAEKKPNGYGITSLVLGIVSIVFCWVPVLGLVAGILGIIFAVKQRKIFPNGIATGGLVTSIIGLVFSGIYSIFWLFLGAAFSSLAAFA
ncbi:hypothetical protein KY348_07765 [Candidatus Woesearchaeota archaeon]|nr:hypothetical protein [Candidatus Woesearchaeota archaeon]